jgi:DNA replication protein DnaC
MTKQAELAYLFRTLKAPAAARALPKLADRARAEEWSYERFAEALLHTEVSSRDAHGGEARIKAARFPPARRSRSLTSASSARCRRRSSSTSASSTS